MIYGRDRLRRLPRRWTILVPVIAVAAVVAGVGAFALLPTGADVTPLSQGKPAMAS
jgi:hypothetical protein